MKSAKRTPLPAQTPAEPALPPATSDATPEQTAEHAAALERLRQRRGAIPVAAALTDQKQVSISPTVKETNHTVERMLDACGTASEDWLNGIAGALVNASGERGTDKGPAALLEGFAFLNGLAPKDEVEAALGAQMFAIHKAAMKAAERVGQADTLDRLQAHTSALVKITRTYAAQVEALAKLRTGGKQQVEVRYIYVDARNSQNVIGSNIAPSGGGLPGIEGQPHVPCLAAAPGLPMRGEDPARYALPATGHAGPEAVFEARRQEPGSAQGGGERSV